MKLGKHAVKVLAVFAVLFVIGFALKFLNLHEGFFVEVGTTTLNANDYNEKKDFLNKVRKTAAKKTKTMAKQATAE